jgi:signal transduction histidine kinase
MSNNSHTQETNTNISINPSTEKQEFQPTELVLHDSLNKQFRELNIIKNNLMQCRSIDAVIKVALQKVQEKLNSQVCSVFLFSKDGLVKRFGILGIDKNKNVFGNSWFPNEMYETEGSFSARSIPHSSKGNGYGELTFSNDLRDFNIEKESESIYSDKLGILNHGISIPLSGKNRTFGTIEVINKLDQEKRICINGFSHEDIYWLMNISSSLSAVISSCRQSAAFQSFEKLSQKMMGLDMTDHYGIQGVYNRIVNFLTEDFMPYSVCILRRVNDGYFELEAISHPKISSISRDDAKRKPEGILGKVYNSKKLEIISRIYDRRQDYHNIDWIVDNGLVSHACFPLVVKDKCVGTISVFTKYEHKFYEDDISFLQTISFLAGSFIARVNLESELRKTKLELRNEQDAFIKATHLNDDDENESFVREISHRYKHELIKFQELLRQVGGSHSQPKRDELIETSIEGIKKRIQEISQGFKPNSLENVDINRSMKNTVKLIRQEKSDEVRKIDFVSNYGDLPTIPLNSIEIESVFYNLLINAIRAISSNREHEHKEQGEIEISTEIKDSFNIQVSISDNGVGIPKENINKIFDRGFTTNKSTGTGIGLFVTKKVLDRCGGSIEVHSQVNHGTTMILTIPMKS